VEAIVAAEQPTFVCAEFHDIGSAPPPSRSWWPTVLLAPAAAELVQLLQ
jgi:hypothetical protein